MISGSSLDELHRIALAVAPELAAAPLYLLESPPGYPAVADTVAFTPVATDWAIRAHLVERGIWAGPGPVIVFCESADDETMAAITLHEVAHVLPAVAAVEDYEPTPNEVARQASLVSRWATAPANSHLPPWRPAHGAAFIRRCLHLHHRAAILGVELPLPSMHFGGWQYSLSGAWKYRRALGDEPQRMAGCSFAEIQATPPPVEFIDLFTNDVADWYRSKAKQEQELEAACL